MNPYRSAPPVAPIVVPRSIHTPLLFIRSHGASTLCLIVAGSICENPLPFLVAIMFAWIAVLARPSLTVKLVLRLTGARVLRHREPILKLAAMIAGAIDGKLRE